MKTCLLVLLFSLTAHAEMWRSNKDHSEVFFQVPYMSVSELTGRFREFESEANFNSDPEKIFVKIKADSLDTDNKLRDGHLKGADFFESSYYPFIIFKGEKVQKLKASTYRVTGPLTIKNITRTASIDFTVSDPVKDTWGYQNRFVKFKSKINRKNYRMSWNKTLDEQKYLVGDEITFWGVFQMQPNKGMTPPSKHMIPDTEYIRDREQKLRDEEKESPLAGKIRKLINGQ